MRTPREIRAIVTLALTAAALAAVPAYASAPHIDRVRCYDDCLSGTTVLPGGRVEITGEHFAEDMHAVFPITGAGGGVGTHTTKTRLTTGRTLIARVPDRGRSGKLYVLRGSSRSNFAGVRVGTERAAGELPHTPFDDDGMWIWYVSKSSGGDTDSIIAKARAHDIGTVYVKSGDDRHYWSQFSSSLIRSLKAGGLNVCAWQFVYGDHPRDEAKVAAHAIDKGADCFVIDAEGQYEGKYSSARKYMRRLRAAAGDDYPIALAGFPYVDYHPAFPFSVFFGPGGAQYNLPQAYWRDIGGSVDEILDHTYLWNLPYGKPIRPLGQLYQGPSRKEIMRFRKYSRAEGAPGVSWWDWQEASLKEWRAVGDPMSAFSHPVETGYATLAKGDEGDLVLWAQMHLDAAGESTPLDGEFGSGTKRAVRDFQTSAGLSSTGKVDSTTWTALLGYSLKRGKRLSKASARRTYDVTPRSARLPAKRYEIRPPAERAP
ncbi:MAG: peptidoglycan-binding protein [Thermoleophilaceae bacterium]